GMLGPKILGILRGGGSHDAHTVANAEPVPLQSHELAWIVRQHSYRTQADVQQDLRTDAVVSQVRLESQPFVRLHGIGPAVLKLVRLKLVQQPDPPPFLVEVYDDSAPFALDHAHGSVQLPSAVTSLGVEHVARQALRVHP